MKVIIDPGSGFCGGVIRAISRAERFLATSPGCRLYSLGAIVHNEAELKRLGEKGLVTVTKEGLRDMEDPRNETLLIRAHGEPPETYSYAESIGINLIDCTCPVVLKLQKSIREAWERLHPQGGQVIIFGKVGHAEVLGLLGQVGGDAVVVEDLGMLLEALQEGEIRTDVPLEIFSQTTKSPSEYSGICDELSRRAQAGIKVHRTICSQVASRHEQLSEFAAAHDIIIFVSGVSSSNGKVLYDLCKSINPRTFHISAPDEADPSWFRAGDRVGICGATSTPRWLLEDAAGHVAGMGI